MMGVKKNIRVITAGPTYLDIDAYACMVALAELLRLQGMNVVAYSRAPYNYSVCRFLVEDGQIARELPEGVTADTAEYMIVDVSDPAFLEDSLPLNKVVAIYDHHTGAEDYWMSRIGEHAHIEFIGAAATLIYREWKAAGLEDQISLSTARLLVAAILDNTLNLTSSNTTDEDVDAFEALCRKADIDDKWCAAYFSAVQTSVEADLKQALFGDLKRIQDSRVLPERIAQLCVWNANSLFEKLPQIRAWFGDAFDSWMINMIDIRHRCSWFVCDSPHYQTQIERIFDVRFEEGVARTDIAYLRKEIIKKAYFNQ